VKTASRASLGAVLAGAIALAPALAQDHAPTADKPAPGDQGELGKDARDRLEGGLRWLAASDHQGKGGVVRGERNEQEDVASTALAGLAWLASGSSETRGPYARNISEAAEFILGQKKPVAGGRGARFHAGDATNRYQGRMHAHGFALLFLAELYGMSKGGREERARTLREALKEGVRLSIASQTKRGGWGYDFAGESAFQMDEASTTITQIQALRSARNAGIEVPPEVIENAIKYVKRSMTKAGAARYSLSQEGKEGERTSFELTAAAVSSLNASGVYRSDELERGLEYMRKLMAKQKDNRLGASENYYFYGNFYAAQAMFQSGNPDWSAWFRDAQTDLIAKAHKEGDGFFWPDDRNFGDAYATASACLILAIPLRYLPIFER
jgi:hypothetical protein